MSGPKRIQRKRSKGWKMPAGAVYVGRGSRWGNPVRVGEIDPRTGGRHDADSAVERFLIRLWRGHLPFTEAEVQQLRGKDLACWCPLDQRCHADALLEIANGGGPAA